jgi:hypothetical protein
MAEIGTKPPFPTAVANDGFRPLADIKCIAGINLHIHLNDGFCHGFNRTGKTAMGRHWTDSFF